jgi:hypothetical protein
VGTREIWFAALRTRTHSVLWKKNSRSLSTGHPRRSQTGCACSRPSARRFVRSERVGGIGRQAIKIPRRPHEIDWFRIGNDADDAA